MSNVNFYLLTENMAYGFIRLCFIGGGWLGWQTYSYDP